MDLPFGGRCLKGTYYCTQCPFQLDVVFLLPHTCRQSVSLQLQRGVQCQTPLAAFKQRGKLEFHRPRPAGKPDDKSPVDILHAGIPVLLPFKRNVQMRLGLDTT